MKPTTLEECIPALMEELSPQEQMEFIKSSKKDLVKYHHNLGRWIRNSWGLWEEDSSLCLHMKSLGFRHADDMSHSILKEFWNRLNHLPSEIEEDVKEYNEYWNGIYK